MVVPTALAEVAGKAVAQEPFLNRGGICWDISGVENNARRDSFVSGQTRSHWKRPLYLRALEWLKERHMHLWSLVI